MKYQYQQMKRRITSLVLAVLAGVLFLTPTAYAADSVNIGILQYVEHESLSATREGFVDQLAELGYEDGDSITINYLNAAADNANMQSMAESLANDSDYIFAISTPAAQSVANVAFDIPVYFSAVTDPVAAGLVESLEEPGANVTGTIDAGPIQEQVDLMLAIYPDAQRIGLVYNSGEVNSASEAQKAREIMEELGLEVIEQTVTSTNDISQNLTALMNQEVDAIFTVTDNTIASAMSLVGDLAKAEGLGIIGGSKDMTLTNGLATYGLDYYELGRQTARMLVRQIEEELETSELPVEAAENLELVINEDYAAAVSIDPAGIELPEEEGN